MRQHFKGIVWPREPIPAKIKIKNKTVEQPCYRYTVVGILVTDEPIPQFEGKNEILLDGPVLELAEPLTKIKSRKPKLKTGDASNVLHSLIDL